MVKQHHWFTGHESEQTPGDSEGQGSHKDSEVTVVSYCQMPGKNEHPFARL